MKTRYRYIHFVKLEDPDDYKIRNNRTGDGLGHVCRDTEWERFVFTPDLMTKFDVQCLADVQHFMGQLEKPKGQKPKGGSDD